MHAELIDETIVVINALEDLGVRSVIGAWLACVVPGVSRTTLEGQSRPAAAVLLNAWSYTNRPAVCHDVRQTAHKSESQTED
jgi:hypothetical protein